MLGLLGQKLCHLLGVSRCSVYLRGSDGRFRGAAGYCEHDGDISAAVRAQEAGIPGDGFSLEVIATAAPVLIADVPGDPRPHRRTMEHWHVRAMLGVPLVFDGEVIGLIFVDNVQRDHDYTPEDVALAELFARVAELGLRTLIFDVEPLVAPWNGGQQGLDRGVAEILGRDELLSRPCRDIGRPERGGTAAGHREIKDGRFLGAPEKRCRARLACRRCAMTACCWSGSGMLA